MNEIYETVKIENIDTGSSDTIILNAILNYLAGVEWKMKGKWEETFSWLFLLWAMMSCEMFNTLSVLENDLYEIFQYLFTLRKYRRWRGLELRNLNCIECLVKWMDKKNLIINSDQSIQETSEGLNIILIHK